MLAAHIGVGGGAFRGVLRRERAATHEVASAAGLRVIRDAFPKQTEHDEIAMLTMHTGAAQFNDLGAEWSEDVELKFLGAIVAEVRLGVEAGLQAVGADDMAGRDMLDQEVIA